MTGDYDLVVRNGTVVTAADRPRRLRRLSTAVTETVRSKGTVLTFGRVNRPSLSVIPEMDAPSSVTDTLEIGFPPASTTCPTTEVSGSASMVTVTGTASPTLPAASIARAVISSDWLPTGTGYSSS